MVLHNFTTQYVNISFRHMYLAHSRHLINMCWTYDHVAFILFMGGNTFLSVVPHDWKLLASHQKLSTFSSLAVESKQSFSLPRRNGITQDPLQLNISSGTLSGPMGCDWKLALHLLQFGEISQLPWTLSRSFNIDLRAAYPWPCKWGQCLGGWQNPKRVGVWISKCLFRVKQPVTLCAVHLGLLCERRIKFCRFCHCYLGSFC